MSVEAKARVRITVEVSLSQPWDEVASVGDVFRRGSQQAREILVRALSGNQSGDTIRMVGDPEVVCVTAEKGGTK